MHTRCSRGKVGKKFKILIISPIEVKVLETNQNSSRIYLKKKPRLFYFANYSISIYTNHKFSHLMKTATSSCIYKTFMGYNPEEVRPMFLTFLTLSKSFRPGDLCSRILVGWSKSGSVARGVTPSTEFIWVPYPTLIQS